MLKKILKTGAALLMLAAGSLCFAPVRSWASQEGSYLYHALFLNGPAVYYGASSQWTDSNGTAWKGVYVTTGTPSAMTGVVNLRFLGALGAKPASSSEGDFYYDISIHSIVFATGTSTSNDKWVKAFVNTTSGGFTFY